MNAVLGERFAPCSRLIPRRAGLEGFASKNARFLALHALRFKRTEETG